MICSTSLWPELVALPDQSAMNFVRAIHDHIVCRYGIPQQLTLVMDNARSYSSKLTEAFAKAYGIRRSFASPYHHSAVCRAEKFGQILNEFYACWHNNRNIDLIIYETLRWDIGLQRQLFIKYRLLKFCVQGT